MKTMSKCFIVLALIVVALKWSLLTHAAVEKDVDYYVDKALSQGFVLLGKSETPKGHICFRTTTLVEPESLDQSQFHDKLIARRQEMQIDDAENTGFWDEILDHVQSDAKECCPTEIKRIADKYLPSGLKNGTSLNHIGERKILFSKMFELNCPTKTKDLVSKVLGYIVKIQQAPIVTAEKVSKDSNGDTWGINKFCYPLKKF